MKAASIYELKKELEARNHTQLLSFCTRLAKFKRENKELLTFLLFEADDITAYIKNTKQEITTFFEETNTSNIYYIKKSVRKILRHVNKHIRFSSSKQAEAELLIHFCNSIINFSIPLHKSKPLQKIYETQIRKIGESLSTLHPDLQYDLKKQLEPANRKLF
jgi:polyribonucleotide nucleotidyltransferase